MCAERCLGAKKAFTHARLQPMAARPATRPVPVGRGASHSRAHDLHGPGARFVLNRFDGVAERLISKRDLWHKQSMSQSKPILQIYGHLHALSSRGLHVRESARSWKLVVPMSTELLEAVRAFCDRVEPAQAARLLLLLERFMQRAATLPALVEASLEQADSTQKPGSWFEFVVRCVGVDLVEPAHLRAGRDVGGPPLRCS